MPSRLWEWRRGTIADVFGADLRSLAALRIVLAVTVLVDLASRARNLAAHYADAGVLSRQVQVDIVDPWLFSLNFINGTVAFQGALFAAAAAAALAMLVGYRTRAAVFIVWVLMTSIHWRIFAVGSSADDLLRMLLFWSIFLPLGDFWSVDRAQGISQQPASMQVLSVATFALFLQIALMYWVGVAQKSGDAWRVDGTAIYDALSIRELATPIGAWLRRFPELLRALTFGTLALEIVAPLLLFSPVWRVPARMAGLVAIAALHVGIALTLHLGLFSWISAACMVCFLPAWFWDSLVPRLRAAINRSGWVDWPVRMPRAPLAIASWLGLSRAFAFPVSVERSSLSELALSPAAVSPPSISPVSPHPRQRTEHEQLSFDWRRPAAIARNAIAAVSLAFVLLWNLASVSAVTLPEGFRPYGFFLGLNQNWTMFAPYPLVGTSWLIVPGTLANGRQVDVLPATLRRDPSLIGRVDWDEPTNIRATFNGEERWRKYFETLANYRDDRLLLGFGQYICRNWNDTHAGSRTQLMTFDIVKLSRLTLPDQERGPVRQDVLWSHVC